jgi:type IV pilus assembly protein PilO
VAWHESHSDQTAQYESDMATYAVLEAQEHNLKALPAQLNRSQAQAAQFIAGRVPKSDSEVLAELGVLKDRDHVLLSRASYSFRPAIPGLLEMQIDGNVSGGYSSVMHFINDLERDKDHAFFTLRSITLTGEQNGQVNLRVRMTTYMQADAAMASMLEASGRNGGAGGGSESGEVQ